MPNSSCFSFLLALFAFILSTVSNGMSTSPQTPGWKNYISPGGLKLRIPTEWTANAQSDGRIVVDGTAGEHATVWPVFTHNAVRAQDADAIARSLVGKVWPTASFTSLPGAEQTVRLQVRDSQNSGMALFSWVTTGKGTAGVLNIAAAPNTHYERAQPTFAQIFQSVHIQGNTGSGKQPSPTSEVNLS